MPLFGKLFTGQVTFSVVGGRVELRLANFSHEPAEIRSLSVRLPAGSASATRCQMEGAAGMLHRVQPGETVVRDLVIAGRGELHLRWE
jgi:hypothetical protein